MRERMIAYRRPGTRPSGRPVSGGADSAGARYREYYPHLRHRGTRCDPPRAGFIYTLPPRFGLL